MKIIFLGNRGSHSLGASQDNPFERYGGDTTAVAVLCGEKQIVLDTGSGFWKWPHMMKEQLGKNPPYSLSIFYSHYHDDHMAGLPQSPILFGEGNKVDLYGPAFGGGLKNAFMIKTSQPENPDLFKAHKADISFHTLAESGTMMLDDLTKVSWIAVPHGREKSFAYRIDHEEQSFCMISDTHHILAADGSPIVNSELVEFIRGADALVYDSHFSDFEFRADPVLCAGMGHSTGEHGVRLAAAAGIPLLIKHHHHPDKTDEQMDEDMSTLKLYGQSRNVGVIAAQPSLCLDLSSPVSGRIPFMETQTTPQARYAAIRGVPHP